MGARESATAVAIVFSLIVAIALLESLLPLFVRPATPPGRRTTNVAMTLQSLLAASLLAALATAAAAKLPGAPGLLSAAGLPPVARFLIGVFALDFAFGYAAHRSMHAWPALWKYHRVHHSDPFVDVTTSYRTHPVEHVWRHAWLFGAALVLGIPPTAVATFRVLSSVNALFEHANLRVPPALDAALSRVWVTPNMHKVHHSRDASETNSNYGNLFAVHDHLLGTFVPTRRALGVRYGLEGVEPAEIRSFAALLWMPWRRSRRSAVRPTR